MANAFYNRSASFNPDELADGDAIEAEFDAVSRGFDTIEDLVDANKAGYPSQTFHVAPATETTHAVQKAQLDSGLAPKLNAADYNAADVLNKLKTVDGSSSGLDADLLDGQEGAYYRNASNINAGTLAKERLPASIDASTSGNAATASKVSGIAPDGGTADLVSGAMADSDFFRIRVGGVADAGWTEIATADGGNEPIYVRQYSGLFQSPVRTLTLLGADGHTRLPQNCYANGFDINDGANEKNGLYGGNADGASSSGANVVISSWFGIGFSPSISGRPVPVNEMSHWFDTRSGNGGMRGTLAQWSDERLKTEITVIPNAIAKVNALRGVIYTRKDSGERCTGMIAQEVQAVLPEAVTEGSDEDKTLSVAYGNTVGLLVEAIKELAAKVEILESRLGG